MTASLRLLLLHGITVAAYACLHQIDVPGPFSLPPLNNLPPPPPPPHR